jgi:hypothetical protein
MPRPGTRGLADHQMERAWAKKSAGYGAYYLSITISADYGLYFGPSLTMTAHPVYMNGATSRKLTVFGALRHLFPSRRHS